MRKISKLKATCCIVIKSSSLFNIVTDSHNFTEIFVLPFIFSEYYLSLLAVYLARTRKTNRSYSYILHYVYMANIQENISIYLRV